MQEESYLCTFWGHAQMATKQKHESSHFSCHLTALTSAQVWMPVDQDKGLGFLPSGKYSRLLWSAAYNTTHFIYSRYTLYTNTLSKYQWEHKLLEGSSICKVPISSANESAVYNWYGQTMLATIGTYIKENVYCIWNCCFMSSACDGFLIQWLSGVEKTQFLL